MTSVRYGIKTTLRAKGRTRLFALLILVLTIALVLGVGIWTYCEQLLVRLDETYISIVLAEYMGENYPDSNAADEQARAALAGIDEEAVSAVEGVELWERTDSTMAGLEGYKSSGGNVPYSDRGVIVVSEAFEMDNGLYLGRISDVLYTKEGKAGIVSLFDVGDSDLTFEFGKEKNYLLHGKFVHVSSNRMFVVTDFYEGCEIKPWLELSGDDDPALTNSIFTQTADLYQTVNNAVTVTAGNDIAALEVFQQGTLYLEDGRFPLPNEEGVCILSGSTAEQMGVGVGDSVNVSLLASKPDDRYDLTCTDDARVWEIVGITNKKAEYAGFIWVSKAEGGFSDELFGYELGRAVLDNGLAVQAVAELQKLMPDQVRLTLYDQGYSAAVKPIQDLRSTAVVLTVVTAFGALAVLFLFAYLFVGRQRETVQVMTSLGTPSGKIRLWLLSGASLIAFTASAVGTVAGFLSLNLVTGFALLIAQKLFSTDTLYSNAALGVIREVPNANGVSVWYSLAAGTAVFLTALILCLAFLRRARREDTLKKGKTVVRIPKGKTSLFGKGAARFALLSVKRGGRRSGIVPAVVLVLTILLGTLTVGASGWKDQLNELYENSSIEGSVVSLNGRNATNLVVSVNDARKLWQSGLLSDISVSLRWNYWLEEEMPNFADNPFGEEAKAGWISNQPTLNAASGLSATAEFYYTDKPEIQWLDGWDESFFDYTEFTPVRDIFYSYGYGKEVIACPAIAGKTFLEDHGLQPGDEVFITIRISLTASDSANIYDVPIPTTNIYDLPIPIKIVGTFQPTGQKANIYVPLSFWCNREWITEDTSIMGEGETVSNSYYSDKYDKYLEKLFYSNTTFKVCRFTLDSAYDLEAFKAFLADNSYSQVGKTDRNRITVLMMDQEFTETLSGLKRYITFGSIMLPILFLAVAMMGFIMSWLMINGRRMEFAILRGLGATRRRVFETFFIEQGLLCVIGCLTGAVILTVITPVPAIWLAAAGFIACYLAGCALSIAAVGRINLMELLSERE